MVPIQVHQATATMDIPMNNGNNGLVRLLQLASPSLPTGAFSYSQGLEWTVEADWVKCKDSLAAWLSEIMQKNLALVDLPILKLMYSSCEERNLNRLKELCQLTLACRESYEMQQEEIQRGRAMATLLTGLETVTDDAWKSVLGTSQLAGFSYAAFHWDIELNDAATGYVWGWLENQVLAGVKIIPLGQTAGQQLLLSLGEEVEDVVAKGLSCKEEEIGASSPALALASSFHETQYTRLYRS